MASGGSSMSRGSQQTYIDPLQAPYLADVYRRAQELSNQPRSYYPGSTVTPFSAETEAGLAATEERGRLGSPLVDAASGYTGSVLRGDYLRPESNPYLGATYEAAARPVVRSLQTALLPGASLGVYGRGGSGAEANRQDRAYDVAGRTLRELAADVYGTNYARERGVMEAAAGRAPVLGQEAYRDAAALREVGGVREDYASRLIQEAMDRFYFGQEEPRQRLEDFANFVGQPTLLSRGKQKSSSWNAEVSGEGLGALFGAFL